MGHFRFHRSVGLGKFLRLNVSKRGFSISGGVPGAHINVPLAGKRRRSMLTVGLPGSGLSYRQQIGSSRGSQLSDLPFVQQVIYVIIGIAVIVTLIGVFG